jgi:hypothetical protein
MEKRYQVFVSSTYQDLVEERFEVIQALLELDCIPCGMEYFPAADDTQWDFIKKLIDESDYYLVVVAGKYGSTDENGISYTQKEYEYALTKNIPIIGFVHKNSENIIASKTERDNRKRKKLDDFKSLVKKKLCKYWETPQDLGSVVSRSMSQAKKNYPRIGWVRADSISENSEKEILQLYKKIETLENEISKSTKFINNDITNLADGDEKVNISVELTTGTYQNRQTIEVKKIQVSWFEIQYHLLAKLIQPMKEASLKQCLNVIFKEIFIDSKLEIKLTKPVNVTITNESLDTVKVQLQALGLINFYIQEIVQGYSKNEVKLVNLTAKGETRLLELRALKKT